jgi:hypothetical protein
MFTRPLVVAFATRFADRRDAPITPTVHGNGGEAKRRQR